MVFSSTIFVFGFLPIALLGNILLCKYTKIQNIFLLLISLLFYAWGEPRTVYLMAISIFVNWAMAILVEKSTKKVKVFWLVTTIVYNLSTLFVFKYFTWSVEIVNRIFSSSFVYREIVLPIGISFYTFQAISYVVDVFKGSAKASKSIISVGLYIAFFPQLVAGPIVRYTDIEKQIISRKLQWDSVSDGILRFMTGFIKKVLLADSVAVIANKAVFLNNQHELGGAMAWLGAIAYTFQIFLDFSAYSDMAIGLGRMFGFSLPENFNYPYCAKSVRDFWRRWHISLSGWFRDYVYIPLGGSKKSNAYTYMNLAIVWLLTGIWHGANWNFVFWGMGYGIFIMLERALDIEKKIEKSKILALLYRIFTILLVVILWVPFRIENAKEAIDYIGKMFNISDWMYNIELAVLYISEYKWELLGCLFFSFIKLKKTEKMYAYIIKMAVIYVLFIIAVSYLIKGTYSPFLYFNF